MVIRHMRRMFFGVLAAGACLGVASVALAATDYLGVARPKVHGTPSEVTTCAACHGAKGVAISPAFPNLAGQNYNYLLKALEAFREGTWSPSPMNAIIATVPKAAGNANLKQLAAYFSEQKLDAAHTAGAAASKLTLAEVEAGYRLYFEGDLERKVPACAACHLATGLGDAPMAVPRLAGQNTAYLVSQLQAFAAGKRKTAPDHVMGKVASRLTAKDITAVADYLGHMHPELLPGQGPKTYDDYVKSLKGQAVPGIPASAIAPQPKEP